MEGGSESIGTVGVSSELSLAEGERIKREKNRKGDAQRAKVTWQGFLVPES